MDPVPPMLVGVSITGSGAHLTLPRAGTPVPEIAPADATHVSFLPMIEGFLFSCLFDFFCFAGARLFYLNLVHCHG